MSNLGNDKNSSDIFGEKKKRERKEEWNKYADFHKMKE